MSQKIILKISGMDCASCAAVIEHDLKKKKGVASASVNLATEKAYVEFDPAEIKAEDIKKSISDLGYKASDDSDEMDMSGGEHDHSKMQKDSEIKGLRNRFVFSLLSGLPVIYMVMGAMVGLPMPAFFSAQGGPASGGEKYGIYLQAILATAVIIICFNIWQSGARKLLKAGPNMDTLILIGTATAYFYSLINLILLSFGKYTNGQLLF